MNNTTLRFKLLRFKRLTKIKVCSELKIRINERTSKVKPNTDTDVPMEQLFALKVVCPFDSRPTDNSYKEEERNCTVYLER